MPKQDHSARSPADPDATTLPLREAVRRTGISAELLRAWERRYGAVTPLRTPGGSRRYTAHEVERLTRIKAAVDAGHRISQVVSWGESRWDRFLDQATRERHPAVDEILAALTDLDGERAERGFSRQLADLGPVAFAQEIALPVLDGIGFLWTQQKACVASEHLASALLRTLLGGALHQPTLPGGVPRVLLATPAGERHELGLLVAALVARGAGANTLYLGPELPPEEFAEACRRTRIDVVVISILSLDAEAATREIVQLRSLLDPATALWIGGEPPSRIDLPRGVVALESLDELHEQIVALAGRPMDS